MIKVNPKLTLAEAQASMKPVADYVTSMGGEVVIETLPTWNTFFNKYVTAAQSVSEMVQWNIDAADDYEVGSGRRNDQHTRHAPHPHRQF